MGNKQDEELQLLLAKLYTIQEQVGAVEKTSDEEKKNRAATAGQVQMGKGRKGKKTGSRFLELKSNIVDRLKSVHALQEEQSASKSLDPKVGIQAQAEIRELVRQAQDEWNEMNELYKKEARKKKSKFTPEELEVQQALVMQLNAEIEKVKDVQMAGYSRGGMVDEGVKLNLGTLAALDAVDFQSASGELINPFIFECAQICYSLHCIHVHLFCKKMFTEMYFYPQLLTDPSGGGKSWTSGPTGVAMTGSQQVQLQQIRDRDAEFDQDLDEIGEGIQDLHELALRQGEEVQRQNQMLNEVGSKIDAAHEHMINVNAKMKDTLNEVGRSSDKLCVDIMCIVSARILSRTQGDFITSNLAHIFSPLLSVLSGFRNRPRSGDVQISHRKGFLLGVFGLVSLNKTSNAECVVYFLPIILCATDCIFKRISHDHIIIIPIPIQTNLKMMPKL